MNPFAAIGRGVLSMLAETGRFSAFAFRCASACFAPPIFLSQLWRQCLQVGYYSLPVIGLTAVFIGAALALNMYTGGARFNAEQFVPQIVVLGIVRELGPVLAGLMLSGRVSAGIAAEIGTMRVTEQIDALRSMASDPVKKLVVPKLAATLLMLPVLTIIGDALGILGGMVIAVAQLNLTASFYMNDVLQELTIADIASGVGKSFFFAYFIAIVGCYNGLNAEGGADGVGRATTNTVVLASILVLISDFFLTKIFFLL